MNEQMLFTAIGSVDESYLMELQNHPKRLSRKPILIAAIIAIALTACAAPAIIKNYNALKNGNIADNQFTVKWSDLWEHPEKYFINGNYLVLEPNTVEVEVNAVEDAPKTIEQIFLPRSLLDYSEIAGYELSETLLKVTLSMNVPRYGKITGVIYQQQTLPESGKIKVENFVGPGIWNQNIKKYGDISVLEIDGKTTYDINNATEATPRTNPIYTKHIFWSDGEYLYCLKTPITYTLPATAIESILNSLSPIQDLSDY